MILTIVIIMVVLFFYVAFKPMGYEDNKNEDICIEIYTDDAS